MPDEAAPTSAQLLAGLDYDDWAHFSARQQAHRYSRQYRRVKTLHESIAIVETEQRYGDAIALAEQMLAYPPEAEAHHRTRSACTTSNRTPRVRTPGSIHCSANSAPGRAPKRWHSCGSSICPPRGPWRPRTCGSPPGNSSVTTKSQPQPTSVGALIDRQPKRLSEAAPA